MFMIDDIGDYPVDNSETFSMFFFVDYPCQGKYCEHHFGVSGM